MSSYPQSLGWVTRFAGLSIMQAPRYAVRAAPEGCKLVAVRQAWQPSRIPAYITCLKNHFLSTKARVFIDWIVHLFKRDAGVNFFETRLRQDRYAESPFPCSPSGVAAATPITLSSTSPRPAQPDDTAQLPLRSWRQLPPSTTISWPVM